MNLMARYHYVFVVMDLAFSEINSVELIRRMRELEQTPILVLSAHATRSEEVETLMLAQIGISPSTILWTQKDALPMPRQSCAVSNF